MKALVVVDMQNDFIDGPLGTDEAVAIIPKIRNKVNRYRLNNDLIIFTKDTHNNDYLNTQEGKLLPMPHCIEGTVGYKITSQLTIKEKDLIIKKDRFAADFPDLTDVDSIELVGVCTDICVVSNALMLKAKYPEKKIIVDAECCAGVTPEKHKAALDVMESCQIYVLNK